MDETTKATTPYFPSNRGDEHDFYEVGFREAMAGVKASPPSGKVSKASSYMCGWLAGNKQRRELAG